ncbi:hypothetical protein QF023_002389 [Chryseobacterium sp. SLBN-27]|nr:hypothetical protein [Chryseobacterium sp. SLBN-27]
MCKDTLITTKLVKSKKAVYDENHKNLAETKNLFTFTPNKC